MAEPSFRLWRDTCLSWATRRTRWQRSRPDLESDLPSTKVVRRNVRSYACSPMPNLLANPNFTPTLRTPIHARSRVASQTNRFLVSGGVLRPRNTPFHLRLFSFLPSIAAGLLTSPNSLADVYRFENRPKHLQKAPRRNCLARVSRFPGSASVYSRFRHCPVLRVEPGFAKGDGVLALIPECLTGDVGIVCYFDCSNPFGNGSRLTLRGIIIRISTVCLCLRGFCKWSSSGGLTVASDRCFKVWTACFLFVDVLFPLVFVADWCRIRGPTRALQRL